MNMNPQLFLPSSSILPSLPVFEKQQKPTHSCLGDGGMDEGGPKSIRKKYKEAQSKRESK